MALYAKINKFGFIEAPYVRVAKEKVGGKYACATTEIVYLQPDDEEKYFITLSGTDVDEKGYLTGGTCSCALHGENLKKYLQNKFNTWTFLLEVVGLSASIIPFLQK